MEREETRKAAEIMLAYADGKEIEFRGRGSSRAWSPCECPSWHWPNVEYRIKERPDFRPFKSKEECWNEMLKHQPFGWIKLRRSYLSITCVTEGNIELGVSLDEDGDCEIFDVSYQDALEYKFADGTPFGVKEEEEA